MSWKDHRFVRKDKEFFVNGGLQLLETAIRKVSPPNPSLKQYIAAENDPRRGAPRQLDNVSSRMSRRLKYLELKTLHFVSICLSEQHIGRRAGNR